MDLEIIPAILAPNLTLVQSRLDALANLVERVQIDIIDQNFAANKTITIEKLAHVNTNLSLEIQLMTQNPLAYLNRCDFVGATRVYGHVEQMPDQEEFVTTATDLGLQVGLALDIDTPTTAIKDMLPHLDGVLLMSTEVGFSGQGFNFAVLKKIDKIRQKFPGDICIDGGLNQQNIQLCYDCGANHFAVNSELWQAKNLKLKLEELKGIG